MTTPALHVERVRHPLKLRQLTVLRVERIADLLVRVTLTGDDLHDFVSASFDDHMKLFFAETPGGPLVLPDIGPSGVHYPEDAPRPAARDYTPRHIDLARRELVIEFVLHGDGPAASWAAPAQAGQTLAVAGPRGSFVVPMDFDWHVLVGDETALPAISRRLEELPPAAQAIVVAEVPRAGQEIPLDSRAALAVQWVYRDALPASAVSGLPAAAERLVLPAGEGYVWVAAEAAVARAVRDVMVGQHGVDKRRIRAASYWKRGAAAVHEAIED